ncbi:MAG: hypothetical protein CVV07_11745 [Gammaproteobacteria bacterium HGW-Gammaproteobacteria-11]|nr:MAG: hypothetical protein CVV07_11745 [Gammaproteobacteria bacterium HGW-Gammaproteobacteria-11]
MHAPAVDALLERDMRDIRAVDIRGTPTFFVNGRPLQQFGPDPLRQLVNNEVANFRE